MANHSQAGKLPLASQLINVAKLTADYYSLTPDVTVPEQAVTFGTSGHRGSSSTLSFNDAHIAGICQALSEYRKINNIDGPLFIGKDTHALSEPALITAIEVLIANDVEVVIQQNNEYTPTPVISQRIVSYNRGRSSGFADGVVITPSHNPPNDGGFKYNQTHGGPADGAATTWIQDRANAIIRAGSSEVKRIGIAAARASDNLTEVDFAIHYIDSLKDVLDMKVISDAQLKLGTDPLGGSGYAYWDRIAQQYSLDITVVNPQIDQRFAFMHCDKDGKIRMDCSSAYAMSGLIKLKNDFDIAFGNDPDFDRHGIVCASSGLMNPNHYLAVAIDYLYQHRPQWQAHLAIGKTLVSSSMIDRVAKKLGRSLLEMPVGFKWFVQGLCDQHIAFAGEESAGGIFLQRDGQTWATDKDGFIMSLLAAEITAVTGKDPGAHYQDLTTRFGEPLYTRIDVGASLVQKQALSSLEVSSITATEMAGESITNVQTHAPGNGASIGGVKVSTENGWFAARPSGTENVYKIYAESFTDKSHLDKIIQDAEALVDEVLK
ncbi:phosphoglucomutase (alpha-D-glucose-1,6-bisphosphate-dependent) [Glaciecola sp. XM2]|uniref:phosphoglucomutase (alpha-D-glucose-1,6-bisphosphate-dependent) n=1 Tax=Glaciecola sp. XM2 TaxID=1914931 RepID=UPI001BDEA47D|nr:phosphoglucomutase (alpha-D-glucose-1,6-bisphosphate-dependent) [Glaciecola sp. XM2]MBT1449464.1 phosphoglucomutase (alpha-D-glucose-1,6-bisphosphate-dependent) [Glaciecola sp. XM2]